MPATRITEGGLIEIAQRFRAMEDQIARADTVLARDRQKHVDANDQLESRHTSGNISYNEWCNRSKPHSEEIERLDEIRAMLERAAEAARDDMVRMQEVIRQGER